MKIGMGADVMKMELIDLFVVQFERGAVGGGDGTIYPPKSMISLI